MARRKQNRAPKKSSASRSSRVTYYYYRTKFVAYGDLLGRDCRIPSKSPSRQTIGAWGCSR